MNSVHEPGPNGDSETLLSRKTRSKTKPGARAPKLAQRGTQDCTGACMPGCVVGATALSWPSCPVVSRPAWPYCSAHARARRVLRPSAVSQRPSAVSQRPSGRVAAPHLPCRRPCCAPLAVSWASNGRIVAWLPGRVAIQPSLLSLCLSHNTPKCIATQFSSQPGSSCHDTKFVS